METGFILKKLISAFIMPLSAGILLLLAGLVLLYLNKLKKAKIVLTISLVWISLFGYVQFSNLLLYPLESRYKTISVIPKDVKHILLLGGDAHNRGWEALRLYHLIPGSKIITSGYAWEKNQDSEALKAAKLLISSGVKKEDIIIHSSVKDTKEEAVKVKELLKDKPFILVTSASHMPRAVAIFKKQGLEPIPSATAFEIKETDRTYDMPNGKSMSKSEKAWHEYLGIIWGYLRGYI
jgi:uncharacterized SAM-binding protein YcdF (DUF218 family)